MSEETMSEEPRSKSAQKREAERLKRFGRDLTELSPEVLARLALPDDVAAAVEEYRRMPNHGAKRRQLQLIGKALRSLDAEALATAEEAMATLKGASQAAIYEHAQLEQWRERLVESDAALTEYLREYPQADRQRLRQHIKRARTAPEGNARTTALRALFRLLRDG